MPVRGVFGRGGAHTHPLAPPPPPPVAAAAPPHPLASNSPAPTPAAGIRGGDPNAGASAAGRAGTRPCSTRAIVEAPPARGLSASSASPPVGAAASSPAGPLTPLGPGGGRERRGLPAAATGASGHGLCSRHDSLPGQPSPPHPPPSHTLQAAPSLAVQRHAGRAAPQNALTPHRHAPLPHRRLPPHPSAAENSGRELAALVAGAWGVPLALPAATAANGGVPPCR